MLLHLRNESAVLIVSMLIVSAPFYYKKSDYFITLEGIHATQQSHVVDYFSVQSFFPSYTFSSLTMAASSWLFGPALCYIMSFYPQLGPMVFGLCGLCMRYAFGVFRNF